MGAAPIYVELPNETQFGYQVKPENDDAISGVRIYSMQGALLLNTKGNLIDVSSLSRGIYIAEIDGVACKFVKR
jgi:hypothetical protein